MKAFELKIVLGDADITECYESTSKVLAEIYFPFNKYMVDNHIDDIVCVKAFDKSGKEISIDYFIDGGDKMTFLYLDSLFQHIPYPGFSQLKDITYIVIYYFSVAKERDNQIDRILR
jgi:hypothetical protein